MVKLVLIQLPNSILTSPKMYFPLGILYLAAVVRNAGFSVEIIDMREGIKPLPEADFYGFSCTTPEVTVAEKLARRVQGITIIGGAHASILPLDCVGNFDYVVRGEGEEVILNILEKKVSPGIISPPRIRDLDKIPYPEWDLVEGSPFSEELFPGERYGKIGKGMTVIGSRGCPYNCSFCANLFNTPITYRSVSNIMGELEELKKRGVEYIRFEDDNITIHPDFEDLCLEIKRLGPHWKCHTRSALLTIPIAEMMKWAGCEECGLGVESADDYVLQLNNKKETCKDHIRAVEILHRAGLRAKTYFIAGLPSETDKTLEFNKEFFRIAKPDKWTLSTFTPYPGCDIYNRPEKYGVTIKDWDYSHWWNFVDEGFVHSLEGQTGQQLWERYQIFYQWLIKESWRR